MYHDYPKVELDKIIEWVNMSLQRLVEKDGELLSPNASKREESIEGEKELNREVHETAINHRLAVHLEINAPKYGLDIYNFDIEYNRYINNRKKVISLQTGERIEVRPDVLVHTRTNFDVDIPHFLVIEAKKHSIIDKDRNHIKDIMHDDNYRYKFGCLISYYESEKNVNCELITLDNGTFKSISISVKNNK